MKIFLDWQAIRSEEDLFDTLLGELGAPQDHGHSTGALGDSLARGGVHAVQPPLCIINLNVEQLEPALEPLYEGLAQAYQQGRDAGHKIRVFEE